MFSTPGNTSSVVSYMLYEQFSEKSNMTTAAMLDLENCLIPETARDRIFVFGSTCWLHVFNPVELIWHDVVNVVNVA